MAARYGNTIGDMASYDAFTLGGPYSVRGFNVGELATARRFVEAAAELRVPVFGRQAYAFIEHGTDLGEPGMPGLLLHLISSPGCISICPANKYMRCQLHDLTTYCKPPCSLPKRGPLHGWCVET